MLQNLNAEKFYSFLYKKLDKVTPLAADCGKLCGGACCKSTGDISGMYIFPGEEVMFKKAPWAKIYDTDFVTQGGYNCKLVTCPGVCNRHQRPLSCRIFPLIPIYENNKTRLVLDPRGKGMCPLVAFSSIDCLSPEFVKAVGEVTAICMNVKSTRDFMVSLSLALKDFELF